MPQVLTKSDVINLRGAGIANGAGSHTPSSATTLPALSPAQPTVVRTVKTVGVDEGILDFEDNPLQALERILSYVSSILEKIERIRTQQQNQQQGGMGGGGDTYVSNTPFIPPTLPHTANIPPSVQSAPTPPPNLGMDLEDIKKQVALIPDDIELTGKELKEEVAKWLK